MPESEDIFEEVKKIRWHQEAIDSNMELLTRAHGKEILIDIMGFFGNVQGKKKAINSARVYLAIDGVRTVGQISTDLKIKIPNVSMEISKLKEMSLIEVKEVVKEGTIYKKRRVDTLLRISQKLIKDFGFDKIPTPVENAETLPKPRIEDATQEEKNE